jgi:hypothetical protein
VHKKQLIEQEHLVLKHYPFEPVTFIAQSTSGNIYYGGYHIYELKSVYSNTKVQDLFPIEINTSASGVSLKDVRVSILGGEKIIDIHTYASKGDSGSSSPFGRISIPRAIINDISSIPGKRLSTEPMNYTIDTNSSS